jgi:Tol biopolymer transport system component
MKKIIRAIFALLAIGAFILATQVSCQKSVAQTSGNGTAPNIILYGKNILVPGSTTDSSGTPIKVWSYQFYIANLDGSNQRTIPITMPTGLYVLSTGGYLTPDGHTIVFTAYNQAGTIHQIYSCSIDGSSLKKLLDIDNNTQLLGAY